MLRIIFTFLAAVLIIYLSYIASKYIGKGMGKLQDSRYMRLIDQIAVGQDRHIAVLQVGDRYLLVGITAGQINILSEIQEDELLPLSPQPEGQGKKVPDFKSFVDKLSDITKKRR